MKPTVIFSVIIPVYKVENYLDKCVRSVINQTYRNIEIILVDDGSPDRCPELCDKYAEEDNRIKVIHKQNGGLSDARNAGIDTATGEYIIFLDSDDYIETDTCEKILSFTQLKPDIIAGDGVAHGAVKNLTHNFDIYSGINGKEYMKVAFKNSSMRMAAWLYVYKKKFLDENNLRFKKGILHEDEEFTPRAFLAAESVVNSRVCFYNYIIRDDSITTNKDLRRNYNDLYNTCTELSELFSGIDDMELRLLFMDSLAWKCLDLFQRGALYRYGKDFINKRFIISHAFCMKTRVKALLYCISPKLYWNINNMTKK